MKKTYYKVLNWQTTDSYKSVSEIRHSVTYLPGAWAKATNKSQLFVFDDLTKAIAFAQKSPIFTCEVKNPRKAPKIRASYFSFIYWKQVNIARRRKVNITKQLQNIGYTAKMPDGTIWCDEVKIKEQIQ